MYFGFQNITVAYGKKTVIEDLNVEFPKGKITTIIGQNGCGKSSLLKTVSKAVTPQQGKILYQDQELSQYPPKFLAQKIAYLAQVHTSPPDIDVRTLVSYGRYPHSKLGRGMTVKDAQVIDQALEMTGIRHMEYQSLSTLSGGERPRAWIAMTIAQEPEILILDEPTTYLDISYQMEVLELVRHLNQKLGITIVMVLHDLNLAARYSDQLYALKSRTLYRKGTPEKILTAENLREIFQIEAVVQQDPYNHCPYFIPLQTHI